MYSSNSHECRKVLNAAGVQPFSASVYIGRIAEIIRWGKSMNNIEKVTLRV
jgi:hypothetical protein